MKLSESIKQWALRGFSEEKCLKLAKAAVKAVGKSWTPQKMQLFTLMWDEAQEEMPEDETPEPVGKTTKIKAPKNDEKDRSLESWGKVIRGDKGDDVSKISGLKAKLMKSKKVKEEKPERTAKAPKVSRTVETRTPKKIIIKGEEARIAFNDLLVFVLATVAWTKGKNLGPVRAIILKNKVLLNKYLDQINMNMKDYNVIQELISDSKKYNEERRHDNVVNFGTALKEVIPNFGDRAYSIMPNRISFLKSCTAYLRSSNPTENQFKNLVNKSAEIRVPEVAALFTSDVQARLPKFNAKDMTAKFERFKTLNKKFGGNAGYIIPTAMLNQLREKPTKEYTEYNELVKSFKEPYLAALRTIIDGSGQNTLDVNVVKKRLAEMGMPYNRIPVNFKGQMDSKGLFYTTEGFKLKDQPAGVVEMYKPGSGTYDPKKGTGYYCWYRKPGGGRQRCYTVNHAGIGGVREGKKQEIVDDFITHVARYRKTWMSTVKQGAKDVDTPDYCPAVMTEAMYQLAPRPGSKEKGKNTKYDDTKGFIYLKKSDVSVKANKIEFNYTDKNGPQHLMLTKTAGYGQTQQEAVLLFEAVKYFYDKCKTKDCYIWTNPDGSKVEYTDMNKYIKRVMPLFKLHKFRNAKATWMAQNLLSECTLKPGVAPSKEVEAFYIDVMTQVGAELGHHSKDKPTPSMAISAYVLKSTSNAFFDKYNVMPSQRIATHLNKAE